MIKINKPVVFITGGSRGIGKALVEKFQSENWYVAACATNDKSVAASGADMCLACDVANASQVRLAIQAILAKVGRLDAVINNAGIAGANSLHENDNDDLWHNIIDVNLHGTYYVCKYALPYLPNETGRIINISSVLGVIGVPDQSAYCASKHAVIGFTKSLSSYAAERRITVNAICPGWTRTDMGNERLQAIGMNENSLATSVALGRFVEPEEVADLTYFLVASPGSRNITGQAYLIDGGGRSE